MLLASRAAVAVASVLILVKLAAWLLTDSVAMLSTLVDSLLDVCASLINLFAVRHALQPADQEHRFGHGKAEALAGLGQSAFIAGSAVFLLLAASQRLITPQPLENTAIGIAVMAFSILLTLALVIFQRSVIRRTGSVAIRADSLHYVGDLLTSGAVILAFVLASNLGWAMADPLMGAAIAVYILYNAWQIARSSLDILMDRELPDEDRRRIHDLAVAHPEVVDMHDLRTRSAGQQIFIQLHLEMEPTLSLMQAHEIADSVETEIRQAFPDAEVLIHQDPAGVDEDHPRLAG
ncbi:MAG: cation diffusion facilitator family transporter [Alphaproteobacteria bacterium]|nr:cation diffusion facilitator family transporter [Alphaproteobacteria bacterium]